VSPSIATFYGQASDSLATNRYIIDSGIYNGIFATGTHDYFVVSDGTSGEIYRDSTSLHSGFSSTKGIDGSNSGTRWRSRPDGLEAWVPDLTYAAIYNISLSNSQRAALISAIEIDEAAIFSASKTIVYGGSWRAYPVVTIVGPITDPVLTNATTGQKLDFTGITIASENTYIIDCRYGYKTVKNAAGVNKLADLTSDSDLAEFHIAPSGEVNAGNNAFTLTGTLTDANTQVTIAYNERFIGI
jgi:hypothetical protein